MSHVDIGTLTTIRDGGLVDGEARHHVDGCAACRAALDEAGHRKEVVSRALNSLDAERPVDLERAKAAVRARLDTRREATMGGAGGMLGLLGRAAVLLLLATGAVYALPGSPLRGLLDRSDADPVPAVVDGLDAGDGVEVGVPASGLIVGLSALEPGATVEVRWREGRRATIEAGAGTRYSISSGRADALVGEGDVVVGVPREGGPLTIEANGRMIFRRDRSGVTRTGEVVSETSESIVFSVGAR